MQCERCWWFGHRTDKCERIKVCRSCGIKDRHHDSEACFSNPGRQKKCPNCDGDHPANDKECPVWVRQIAIGKIRCQHQVGYQKAAEILKKQTSRSDNNSGWDGTDSSARGGRKRDNFHAGPAPAGPSRAGSAGPSRSNDNGGTGMSGSNAPRTERFIPLTPSKSPTYAGAVHSPPRSSKRNLASLQDPIRNAGKKSKIPKALIGGIWVSGHGPAHTLSEESSDMDADSDREASQVLPRRSFSSRPLRPLPQDLTLPNVLQHGNRQPGLPEVGEAPGLPARKPELRDFGTQTDDYAHQEVQTDNYLELELVIGILRAIPTICKFENNTFAFSEEKTLTLLNRSLGLDLTPEFVSRRLSG